MNAIPVGEAALAALAVGLNPLPPREDGSKAPDAGEWASRQTRMATEAEVRKAYANGRTGLGLVCGAVSGGLELFEFEGRAIEAGLLPNFVAAAKASGLGDLVERIAAGYTERTPSGGLHWLIRTTSPVTTKLASQADHAPLIETKGEGGFTITAPSHGSVHPSGKPWELVAGSFATIATITAEEHVDLHRLAATFDQRPRPAVRAEGERYKAKSSPWEITPGDDFNARATWAEILEPHGWRRLLTARGGNEHWVRPDKTTGTSATVNDDGEGVLFVFTSSTPFKPNTAVSRFGAHAVLNHQGDFKIAAKVLEEQGYGRRVQRDDHQHDLGVDGEHDVGGDDAEHGIGLPAPNQPIAVARVLAAEHYAHADAPLLRYWRGSFWRWVRSHWLEDEEAHLRSAAYRFTEHATYIDDAKKEPAVKAWAPNRYKVADLLDALRAVSHLPETIDQPAWLDGWNGARPTEIVACSNGLLHVPTRELSAHTPRLFNRVAVPFPYDPQPPPPVRWLAFLEQLWPDDPAAIAALQEWFGYCISGRTDLHKILLLIGPTRAGKGVIARLLAALLGRGNVAGPTLASLGQNFGLQDLVGKPLAVIADARIGGANTHQVVERLLSISGEDMLTIDRKYRDPWTGKLPTRFMVISNELPRFGDASGAIARRFVVLTTHVSWLGRENPRLTEELLTEMPGILAWALDGVDQLRVNGKFTEPSSSTDAITTLLDTVSPTSAFVRDRCTIDPIHESPVDALYAEWRRWCEDNGIDKPGTKQTFGRNLRAVVPSLRVVRPRDGDDRERRYVGLTLRSGPQ